MKKKKNDDMHAIKSAHMLANNIDIFLKSFNFLLMYKKNFLLRKFVFLDKHERVQEFKNFLGCRNLRHFF